VRLKTKRKPSDEANSSVSSGHFEHPPSGRNGPCRGDIFISMLDIFWLMVSKPTLW
jgi:hypothetical protein